MDKEFREKLKLIILNSPYKNSVNCILRFIENANMTSWERLQDLPALGHICQTDVYQLLAIINELWDADLTPKRKRKPKVEEPVEPEELLEENN